MQTGRKYLMNDLAHKNIFSFHCSLFVKAMLLGAAPQKVHKICILVVVIPMRTLAFPYSLPNTPQSYPRIHCGQWI